MGGGRGGPEDEEVTGDAAPIGGAFRWCGGDVVGDQDDPGVDVLLGAGLVGGEPEVHDVAGVVAEHHQHPGTPVDGADGAVHLLRGRAGEDVAADGRVGEAGSDQPGEGGVVARAAADDGGDPTGDRRADRDDGGGAGDPALVAGVRRHQAVDHLVLEGAFAVVDVRHDEASCGAGGQRSRMPVSEWKR
jgi:hypothetical protein